MVTEDDNIFDGLTYEEALLLVCDNDYERFFKAYDNILEILNKIPLKWDSRQPLRT